MAKTMKMVLIDSLIMGASVAPRWNAGAMVVQRSLAPATALQNAEMLEGTS